MQARIELQRAIAKRDLAQCEAYLNDLQSAYEEVSKDLAALGNEWDDVLGTNRKVQDERAELTQALADLQRGVSSRTGALPRLQRFADLPGITAMERIVAEARQAAREAAEEADELRDGTLRPYRLAERPSGVYGKYYVGQRRLKPGETVMLTRAQARGTTNVLEEVSTAMVAHGPTNE
jgi:DNA repair exonuclease SbcCD ATPase subunit